MAQLVNNSPAMWKLWFDPWVGKISWRREKLPTLVFWPGEFQGLYNPWGLKELDSAEQLSLSLFKFAKYYSIISLSTDAWYSIV